MFKKSIVHFILTTFFFTSIGPLPDASAQSMIDLPAPGVMVNRSNSFEPLELKGILVNIKNPLRFDFLVDRGDSALYGQPLKDEITRLSKYFLTCLTVPEDDLWVNLSPYEKDRIVPGNFGITLMGKDLLEQDYLLKQIMASLSYPENNLGKLFWQRVYRRSYELYGTTEIPINTFNKVWIIPKSAQVYAEGNSAFVVNSQLDVMLEADYKSYIHHWGNKSLVMNNARDSSQNAGAYSQVFRDVILPELRQEINEGKNFAVVRQVFNAMILATWYKRHLKDSLLGRMYVGQNKVRGVDIADKNAKEEIFQQYLRAYKKCVYNYIKEDYDPVTQQTVPRKYASGGMYFAGFGGPDSVYKEMPSPMGMKIGTDLAMATVDVTATNSDGEIISFPDIRTKAVGENPFRAVPREVRQALAHSSDQYMVVPQFLRPLILTVVLAVGGFLMTPTMASAAAPVSSNINITANMHTQEAIDSLDKQIISYKKMIRTQESLLNIFDIRGNYDDSNRVLSGLFKEDAYAKDLLAAGKPAIDRSDVISLEISSLTGQIEDVDQHIKQREQKISEERAQFEKRQRSFDMHAAEISMRQGEIRYNEGVLKGFNAEKDQLTKEMKANEDIKKIINLITPSPIATSAEKIVNQVVPDAIAAGVINHDVLPPVLVQPSVIHSLSTNILPVLQISNNPPVVQPVTLLPVNLPSAGSPPPPPDNTNSIILPAAMQLASSSVNNVPSLSPVPKAANPVIPQFIMPTWTLYAGFAIGGIGLALGGASILKRNRSRKLNNHPLNDMHQSPRILPNKNNQSGEWAFNVVNNNGPSIPDEEELAWQKQQEQQQQQQIIEPLAVDEPQISPTVNNRPINSGLRAMDALGLIMSMGLAGVYSGGDLRIILTSALSSLFVTRLIYAGLTFLHENGHNGIALMQSPKDYKEILTWPNFFANYNLPDWLRLSVAFGKPTQRPGVDLPLKGKPRRINQDAGFIITSAVSGLVFWAAAKTGLWLPLFGSLSAASIFALLNSWETDIRNPSPDGRIECGDSGVIWLPKKFRSKNGKPHPEDFFPGFVQNGLVNMRQISGLRGDQGKGLTTLGETRDGDVVPIGYKVLKDKRGKPVAEVAQEGFIGELEGAVNQDIRPIDTVREVMTHDRFLTQGIPSLKGLHPHRGVTEKRVLCFYQNGTYQKRERTIVSIVIENGDNNYHKKHGRIMPTRDIRQFYPIKFHMQKDVFIEPNAKFPKGYYDYLPSGDAPALALQEQWYDNQGDWWAASRFAVDEIFYKNDKEAMEYNLSQDEVNAMGDFYMQVYENGHEQILIRPKLNKKNKTLADSWVTEAMVKQDEKFVFQYNALNQFRADLKRKLLIEADKARSDENVSAVGDILNRLQQLHPEGNFEGKVDRFVNMTVERFFTADILEAAKEIDKLEVDGAYGVRILNTKYTGRGVFWTKGQSIALGVNPEAGYIAYNSEHTALMSNFGDAPPVKEILFLNSEGSGQLTETNYNEDTQELNIRAWSPEKNRFLTEDELKEWRMQLKGKYYTPLLKRDPKTVTDEDIDDITKVTDEVNKRWEDPGSFVRQSADNFVDKLESRFVEDYIKNNSRFYKVMQGNLLFYVEQQAQQCQGSQCASPEYQRQVAALLREVQNDPRILTYLKSRLDLLVAYTADVLSEQIRKGKKTEDDLFPQLKIIDLKLSEIMSREIGKLTQNLIDNNVQFLNDFQIKEGQLSADQNAIEQLWVSPGNEDAEELKPRVEGPGLPSKESIGSGEAVIFAAGLEDSLWIGAENFKAMMHVFFPRMIIETDSSNKALDLKPGDRHKVGRRTIGLIVSKSGATSPSKNLVSPLKQIVTLDNIFATTGTVDTLLGLALGQRYYEDAPFSRRIFPTGNIYPTEVNSVSEVELLVNQINMVLYIVKRMKKTFPHQQPWGMNISEKNIKKMEDWRDDLVNKARHLTGIDEGGNPGTYPEHKKIIHDARIFGKMITETPISNLVNRTYVFGIILLGTPVGALAAFIERKTGLSVHSSGLGHLAWAILDATLACSMPWWITTGFYRLFSKRVQRWARLGPPNVVIGDIPVLHQVVEISASKRGAMAIGSMDPNFHGGNPQDHFGPRFLHRVRRGTVEIFGLPEDPNEFANVLLTDGQSNVRTDMSIGYKIWDNLLGRKFKAGPEIFTIGPGDVDPNSSQHHMSTGPLETVYIDKDGERKLKPDVTEKLAQFHALSFEVYDRLTVYNVFFNESFRWATQWGPLTIHKQGESQSKTGVLSTPSPRGGPKKKMPFYHDDDQSYSSVGRRPDSALLSEKKPLPSTNRDGGIDMNSRLMQLNVTGDVQERAGVQDHAMSGVFIKGVAPQVSQIVTVTPNMLKAMLGEAYLN